MFVHIVIHVYAYSYTCLCMYTSIYTSFHYTRRSYTILLYSRDSRFGNHRKYNNTFWPIPLLFFSIVALLFPSSSEREIDIIFLIILSSLSCSPFLRLQVLPCGRSSSSRHRLTQAATPHKYHRQDGQGFLQYAIIYSPLPAYALSLESQLLTLGRFSICGGRQRHRLDYRLGYLHQPCFLHTMHRASWA